MKEKRCKKKKKERFVTHIFFLVVDGDFCKQALEKQIYIKDELPVLMGGLARLGKIKGLKRHEIT